jgi:cyanophycin synthetase
MRIDDIALARLAVQNHTPDTVPALSKRVVLRNNANLSTGGSATDVTDEERYRMVICSLLLLPMAI